jgi:hypothetical protein
MKSEIPLIINVLYVSKTYLCVLSNILSRFIRLLRFFHVIVSTSEVLGTRVAINSSVSNHFINSNYQQTRIYRVDFRVCYCYVAFVLNVLLTKLVKHGRAVG